MTEEYYCPLAGDRPGGNWEIELRFPLRKAVNPDMLMPGRIIRRALTDAEAEHERAWFRAEFWSRDKDGTIHLWVER